MVAAASKNTWSHQRRKRRSLKKQNKVENIEFDGTLKRKLEDWSADHVEDTTDTKKIKSTEKYIIRFEIEIKNLNGQIHLILKYLEGSSKESMNQIDT